MDHQSQEWLEKIRQQFDFAPYPSIPLEQSPQEDYDSLFIHNLVTAYYVRSQRVIDTRGKHILDVGCGSGYKSLMLAIANPGAHIVGIDLSQESIALANLRLQHHGVATAEFHHLSIDHLPELGLTFDYINCDEVLYLLPDSVAGLQSMKAVLKPEGILRANLHNYLQRESFYQAQELFRMMGLMAGNPGEFEVEIVSETMRSLKDFVLLKADVWSPHYESTENPDAVFSELLMNFLLHEDKGFTIPQLFATLEAAGLDFISMVKWRYWEITDLFKQPDRLPALWQTTLKTATVEKRLHLRELLHPMNRLIDFWCGQSGHHEFLPVTQWSDDHWQTCRVYLHPQLKREAVKKHLITCVNQTTAFEISAYIKMTTPEPVLIESLLASVLLPLWEGDRLFGELVDRYRQIHPIDPITLEPVSNEAAVTSMQQLLRHLNEFCYVLLEQPG